MPRSYNILFLGASYGFLLGAKAALAGHGAQLVCRAEECEQINREGALLRLPARGVEVPIELDTTRMPGEVSATTPDTADPSACDLVVLAMQEPQYGDRAIQDLLRRIRDSGRPCMSIMNMPPLSYLERIPRIDGDSIRACYTTPSVWNNIDPSLVTLCSPDPQAFRPPGETRHVLQVGLATNFKAARFESDEHTAILRRLEADIDRVRYPVDGASIDLPVKLRVHDSVFVPLAKWAMLIAGNYRCVQGGEIISIKDAVHADLVTSKATYDWVVELCIGLGAERDDLVPFEKYANAALSLQKPSSAARALAEGSQQIERVDKLVQSVAASRDMQSDVVDRTVTQVDDWLARNRENAHVA